jgi:ubiquinol-cytochrome c reductase cytochrome c1 subunit
MRATPKDLTMTSSFTRLLATAAFGLSLGLSAALAQETPAPAATPEAAPADATPPDAPADDPAVEAPPSDVQPTGQAPAPEAGAGEDDAEHPPGDEHATLHYPILHPHRVDWSFAGPFGTFDQAQLQRGFKVFQEVCSACHSMSRVAFRNLADEGGPGFTDAQARAIAAGWALQVTDGPNDVGDMFQRPAIVTDYIPSPYANENAARASQGGAYPPDLSLIAKARGVERGFPWFVLDIFTTYQEAGPDYVYSLLTGYQDPPEGVEVRQGLHYNPYFIASNALAMAPPLSDGRVEYTDGSPQTVAQYAEDVSAFLMWTAEPHLVQRKEIGFRAMIFLVVFAGLLYVMKRRVWASIAH